MELRNLGAAIVQSLKQREMVDTFADVLLTDDRTRVRRRDETEYWDYKERVELGDEFATARFAKRVLALHNAKGGVLIVGVDNGYRVHGVTRALVLDSNKLNQKLRPYAGPTVSVFQDFIEVQNGKVLWLIFVPRHGGFQIAVQKDGPKDTHGRAEIRRGEFFIRVNDETKVCTEHFDVERTLGNVSSVHQLAYLYEVDEPYFRLLAPHCRKFVGRYTLLDEVRTLLQARPHIVSLEGMGGVGKSAIAIELVKRLYDASQYMFIVSLSAKRRVWIGYTATRVAGFSGMTEFIAEIAKVFGLPQDDDVARQTQKVLAEMEGLEGLLLIDNIEDVDDPAILDFLIKVPAPVKVLVTSRIGRNFPALIKVIPAMDESDARNLLSEELQQVKYAVSSRDKQLALEDEILRTTGRLPIAIKWAASLASTSGSLGVAASKLRAGDPTKKEFLNFCFKTMFDELSTLAKDVATLSPYLVDEWNIPTLAIALDRSESEIEAAVTELEQRGIVLPFTVRKGEPMRLLPMTLDFLADKWRENQKLTKEVDVRLGEALGEGHLQGLLHNWPYDKRIEFILKRVAGLEKAGELDKAVKLVKLAQPWNERVRDPHLHFIEGDLLFRTGQRAAGIALMKDALEGADPEIELASERLYLASVLHEYGIRKDELLILELLADAIPQTNDVQEDLLTLFIDLGTRLDKNHSHMREVFSKTNSPSQCYVLARRLQEYLAKDQTLSLMIGKPLLQLVGRAVTADRVSPQDRRSIQEMKQRLEERFRGVP